MRRWSFVTVCLMLTWTAGCLPVNGLGGAGTGTTSVSGTVQSQSFTAVAGTAESDGNGNYYITLSDSSTYDCTSTPSGNTVTVVMAGINSAGTFDASNTVTFNVFQNGVNTPESANSGTVTIQSIDTTGGSLSGSLSATGATSNVSGTFDVPICN